MKTRLHVGSEIKDAFEAYLKREAEKELNDKDKADSCCNCRQKEINFVNVLNKEDL